MASPQSDGCAPEIRFVGAQPNEGTVQMIVIGADTHKRTHPRWRPSTQVLARFVAAGRSTLTSRGICPRCAGRADPMTSGCGRSRTARTSRAGSVAKVAIARKMLTLCYYGLRDGEIRCLNVPDRRSR
jgi:hypothetical protein